MAWCEGLMLEEKQPLRGRWLRFIGLSEGSARAGTPGYLRSNPSGVVRRRGSADLSDKSDRSDFPRLRRVSEGVF